MTDAYHEFLSAKSLKAVPVGFAPDDARLPDQLKAFQRDITTWSLRRGRAALFEGTGLGKTLQELAWAREVHHETRRPVLVLTPLAVAEQTVMEAEKFDIDGVAYAADQDEAKTPVVVTNYDRAHLFDFSRFGGVVLDESSILKAHDGKTRQRLTEVCADVPYLLPATATPAPNDWTELGQHAEFLGVMSAKEMLAMYFVHDGANRADGGDGDGWRLKRHAEREFWAWVASWAVMIRSPADLGYDEPGYVLPPLRKHQVTVSVEYGPCGDTLFPMAASTLSERINARKHSLPQRVDAARSMAREHAGEPWVFWCDLNAESDALAKTIPGAVEITGSHARDEKKARMLAFSRGEIQHLVTKPSIAGFGMNWQHCRKTAFVGLNDSFEQVYQAVRRFWRFGQTEAVDAYMIASELEGAVVANQDRKERDFERMQAAMAEHMRDLTTAAVRGGRVQVSSFNPTRPMELPSWMAA
jgi:hypothetical protein